MLLHHRMSPQCEANGRSPAMMRLGAVLLLLVAWVTCAFAAEPVVRIAKHASHTRLAIEWPVPVDAKWQALPGELTLQASEAMPLSIMNRWSDLGGIVATASLSRDQRVLQIGLEPGFDARAMIVDDRVLAIDFTNGGARASPAPMPVAPPSSVGDLSMRLGEHPTFLRVVIEPVMPGQGRVSSDHGHVRISLPGRLPERDIARLARHPAFVADARAVGETLLVNLARAVDVRTMTIDGNKLVIDIPGSGDGDTATAVHRNVSSPQGQTQARGNAAGLVPKPRPAISGATGQGDTVRADAGHVAQVTGGRSDSAHEAAGHSGMAHGEADHAGADQGGDAGHGPAHPEAFAGDGGDRDHGHDAAAEASGSPMAPRRSPPPDLAQLDRSGLVRGLSQAVPRYSRLPVVAAPRERGFELRFLWPEDVPAAVFVRAGYLWVAFHATVDQVAADRETMQRYAGGFIRSIRQEPHDEATVFRFALSGRVAPRVVREGAAWHVLFASGGQMTEEPGLVRTGPEPGLLLEQAEGAVTLGDPVVGDRIGIAFYGNPGMAMARAVDLVNLSFIPAIQGAAWRMKSPDLQATVFERGVLLDRAEGLNLGNWQPGGLQSHVDGTGHAATMPDDPAHADLSEGVSGHATGAGRATGVHDDAAASHTGTGTHGGGADTGDGHRIDARENGTTTSHRDAAVDAELTFGPGNLLGLASVDVTMPSTYWQQKQTIMPGIGDDRADRRFMAHVALARLNLAYGFGREALSHVALARALLPAIDENARSGAEMALAALEAVGNIESGRLEEARKGLGDGVLAEALAGDDEVALWKTVLDIRDGRPVDRTIDEKALLSVLATYGAPMQIELGTDLVRSSLDRGRADPAFVLLDHLDRLPLAPENEASFRRLQATAFARDGDKERALSYLEQAAAVARMPYSLEIGAELDALRLELGRIDHDQALATLESSRLLWRGLPEETDLMRRYGKLLADGSRAEEALEVWQDAAEKAPSKEEARRISEDMSVLFADIIAGRDGWKRTPLQALAIYRRYRELLPAGPVGNELVNGLAGEIDGIGLHSVAAAMLDRQAAFRIDDPLMLGATQLRMARMHLDAGDAQQALDILESGDLDLLGPEEQARRERLLAEALRDLGRSAELDERLAQRDEPWVHAIRVEEAYAAGDDETVEAEALAYLAGIDGESPIADEAAGVLLRLAMVRAGREDRTALADLETRYADRMIDPEDRAMLELVTRSPPDRGKSKELVALSGEYVDETRQLLDAVKTP